MTPASCCVFGMKRLPRGEFLTRTSLPFTNPARPMTAHPSSPWSFWKANPSARPPHSEARFAAPASSSSLAVFSCLALRVDVYRSRSAQQSPQQLYVMIVQRPTPLARIRHCAHITVGVSDDRIQDFREVVEGVLKALQIDVRETLSGGADLRKENCMHKTPTPEVQPQWSHNAIGPTTHSGHS